MLQQYKNAIDQSTIVSKTDTHGRITYANDEFCRLSKYRRDELVGKPHNIVRHPNMPKAAFKELWSTIKAGQTWRGIVENRARDGGSYTVRATILPILDSEGKVQEYIGIRSDITELAEMQRRVGAMLAASQKFVPNEFLNFLNVPDLSQTRIGDHCEVDLTILFADIRNFTAQSERLTGTDTFTQLNEYLSFMEPAIQRNAGFIDKFIGDGIMALFHSPSSGIRAGLEMQAELRQLNEKRAGENLGPLAIGCGVHTGTIVMGTVGTDMRMNTTVIGDAVNTAARLEKLTKKVQRPFLVSGDALERCTAEFASRRVGIAMLRGKQNPVEVFEVFGSTQNTI